MSQSATSNLDSPASTPREGSTSAFRNAAFSAASQLSGKFASFAWLAIAARELTKEGFGVFNLVWSVGLILASVAEWGYDVALTRQASRNPRSASTHYTLAVSSEIGIALPLFAVGAAVTWITLPEKQPRLVVLLVLAAIFLDIISDTARAASAAVQRQGGTALALTLQRVITAALAIPLLIAGFGLIGLGIGFLVSYLAGLALHSLAVRRLRVRFRPGLVRWRQLSGFARGTLAVGVSALVLAVLYRFDALILEALAGSRALADYSAAYKLFDTVLFVTFAVNGALFPVMITQVKDPQRVSRTVESGLSTIALLYLPFAAVCAVDAPSILHLIYGASYAQAAAVSALRFLALAPMMFGTAFLTGSALLAYGRNQATLVAALSATAVNIGLNVVAIPRFGAPAAALLTTIAYAVEALVSLAYLRWGVRNKPALLRPVMAALIAAVALGVGLWVSPFPMVAEVPVGCVGYLACWALLTRHRAPEQLRLLRGAASE